MTSAKHLCLLLTISFFTIATTTVAQSFDITGPPGSGKFGSQIRVLPNGNYVVLDPDFDDGAIANVGAVYLYNGSNHVLISTLKGSTANDRVGSFLLPLTNSNFVISSIYWNNGAATGAGAATWINGTTGLSGVVSSSNSLIGSTNNDNVGISVYQLTNGNYVVGSYYWDNGAIPNAGAATWGNGTTGVMGVISSTNSLIGNLIGTGLGAGATILTNGNYVLASAGVNAIGYVTWCNGNIGRVGLINSSNSLTGNTPNDVIGNAGVYALSNGNYVINSPGWDNGAIINAGAVTWCNGTTGTTGIVSPANSLVGTHNNDSIGGGFIIPLTNGNYVVSSPLWNNGLITDAGAVTWGNGATGVFGNVSTSNSLTSNTAIDNIGIGGCVALSNGNYAVNSYNWDNGAIPNVGAVTWGNGTTGTTGLVSSGNSLTGVTANDNIGNAYAAVTALSNGNYVVSSPNWDNGLVTDAGAATWVNGATAVSAVVDISNSLFGNTPGDSVSNYGVTALTNGNYVVSSINWDNGIISNAGAATWGNGTTGSTGVISAANSLVGSTANDNVGAYFTKSIKALSNGNYVVPSPEWDNGIIVDAGAVTWGDGTIGTTGLIDNNNSLVGSHTQDFLGYMPIRALINGSYINSNNVWDNGGTVNSGAVTFGNGSVGVTGIPTSCNSVLGTSINGGINLTFDYNDTYSYMIVGRPSDNIVTIFDPTGLLLANSLDAQTVNISGIATVPLIANTACRIIAVLTPNGANPVTGTVAAKAWVETTVPTYGGDPFVARHYEITPASNAAIATGRVTLYFTQQEFTDFNNHPSSILNLPTGSSDATGKANLRIGKFSGSSTDGTGLPGSYSGTAAIIDPVDADIIWNNNLSRWEVSFDVTGFSGFFVQTKATVLPVTLLEFNGRIINNNAVLNWKITDAVNLASFDVERSVDGRNYFTLSNVNAINQPGNRFYSYSDNNIFSIGVNVVYYRLKQKDINGLFTYSGIIPLSIINNSNLVMLYPNPAYKEIKLLITVDKSQQLNGKIIDNTGRVIERLHWTLLSGSNSLLINVSELAKGLYYIELSGSIIDVRKQFVKQ